MSLIERPHLPVYDDLEPYEKAFIAEYFNNGFNATEAYYKIVYTGEKVTASEKAALASAASAMLRRDRIKQAISELTAAYAMPIQEALIRVSNIARANLADLVIVEEIGTDDQGNPIERVRFDLPKLLREGKGYLIRELKWNKYGPVVKLHDAQGALYKILDLHGVTGSKRGSMDDPNVNVNLTVEEWKAEQAKRRQQAADSLAQFEDADAEIVEDDAESDLLRDEDRDQDEDEE